MTAHDILTNAWTWYAVAFGLAALMFWVFEEPRK